MNSYNSLGMIAAVLRAQLEKEPAPVSYAARAVVAEEDKISGGVK